MTVAEVVAEVRSSRSRRAARDAFGAGTLTLEEAYRVQRVLAEEREAAGDAIVGWKLGLISAAKQEQMKVQEPIIGHLHQGMLINPGEPLERSRFIQPRLEPELGVVFGRDPSPGDTRGELVRAVAFAVLAVDVLDSIYAGYRFGAADVVADNASGGAVLLGSRPLPPGLLWRQEGGLRLSLDGGEWTEGAVAGLGDPARQIAWGVERAAALGRGVRRGDLLLLGAPCPALTLGEGEPCMVVAEGPGASRLVASVV
ncbi:2-keto-4-pentenoate hydratase [Limnochorda pilosa]|uniref:4-oxalocrotonate decarboxylase n=1 Tax=Limnochorda pilosa TaxID=1555112 RepID=A0A0K2SLX4_LIMPI|nr:fumarylacetoacetate hydrolase family protein [Limnochorda pilosa]BAS28012.1 4-oxalocrotonate decarboxylase [Limnochorda pilosa]